METICSLQITHFLYRYDRCIFCDHLDKSFPETSIFKIGFKCRCIVAVWYHEFISWFSISNAKDYLFMFFFFTNSVCIICMYALLTDLRCRTKRPLLVSCYSWSGTSDIQYEPRYLYYYKFQFFWNFFIQLWWQVTHIWWKQGNFIDFGL